MSVTSFSKFLQQNIRHSKEPRLEMIVVILMLLKGRCIHRNVAVEIFRRPVREDQRKPSLRRNDKQVVPHAFNGPAASVETFESDELALERVQMSGESWPLFGSGCRYRWGRRGGGGGYRFNSGGCRYRRGRRRVLGAGSYNDSKQGERDRPQCAALNWRIFARPSPLPATFCACTYVLDSARSGRATDHPAQSLVGRFGYGSRRTSLPDILAIAASPRGRNFHDGSVKQREWLNGVYTAFNGTTNRSRRRETACRDRSRSRWTRNRTACEVRAGEWDSGR